VRGQDVIFNLAGQSGAVRSMEEPWDDLDVNAPPRNVDASSRPSAVKIRRRVWVFTGRVSSTGASDRSPSPKTHQADPLASTPCTSSCGASISVSTNAFTEFPTRGQNHQSVRPRPAPRADGVTEVVTA